MSRLAVLAALLVALTALIAAPALAGKPRPAPSPTAEVTASPNPAPSGATVWLQGCGFNPNYSAQIRINHSAGYTESYGVAVWYTGCLNPTPFTTREAGTYTIEVYQRPSKPRNAPPQWKASTVLTVTG